MQLPAAFIHVLTALAVVVAAPFAAATEKVDLELVLAADGSGSIDDDELRLQREGWAAALTAPEVVASIRDGILGAVAVAYVEWGGPDSQVTIVDWHRISDAESAARFAAELRTRPRGAWGYNSISNAIDYAVGLVETNAFHATRRIIDVSGDGPNIGGRDLDQARREAISKGFTINALAILRPGGRSFAMGGVNLEEYYGEFVIGGPGAFVETADEARPFAVAARRKLLAEIAGTAPPVPTPRYAGR